MPGNFIAGPHTFTAKIGGGSHTSIGGTEDGITIMEEPRKQLVYDNEYGGTDGMPVDAVIKGTITRVRFTYIRYADVKPLLYANHTQGAPKTAVGHLDSANFIELKATPVAGSTAAADHGAVTFYKCSIDGNFDVLLGSGHTKGPLTFLVYPDPSNSGKTYDVAAVPPPPP